MDGISSKKIRDIISMRRWKLLHHVLVMNCLCLRLSVEVGFAFHAFEVDELNTFYVLRPFQSTASPCQTIPGFVPRIGIIVAME